MTDHSVENSPQVYARTGGALYLVIIALGIFGQVFVRDRIIVSADPAATAANLTTCSRCREPKLAHVACPNCGTYNGRDVLDV